MSRLGLVARNMDIVSFKGLFVYLDTGAESYTKRSIGCIDTHISNNITINTGDEI